MNVRPGLSRIASFTACAAVTAMAAGALALPAAAAPSGSRPAGLTGTEIVNKALNNMRSASSFHLQGSVRDASKNYDVDLWLSRQGCAGSATVQGKGAYRFIVIGPALWLGLSGNWVKVAGKQGAAFYASLSQMCFPARFAHALGYPVPAGITGRTTRLGGIPVVEVNVPAQHAMFYVSLSPMPEILRVTDTAKPGTLTVSGYGQPVTLAAPTV